MNLEFSLWISPLDPLLLADKLDSTLKSEPSIPVTLQSQLETNLFLRVVLGSSVSPVPKTSFVPTSPNTLLTAGKLNDSKDDDRGNVHEILKSIKCKWELKNKHITIDLNKEYESVLVLEPKNKSVFKVKSKDGDDEKARVKNKLFHLWALRQLKDQFSVNK